MNERPQPTEFAEFYSGYVALVAETDIMRVLRDQPAELARQTGRVGPAREQFRYAPDKWSIREMVGHMVDAERVFGFRAFCFSRGESNPLPGFDQNDYVARGKFD